MFLSQSSRYDFKFNQLKAMILVSVCLSAIVSMDVLLVLVIGSHNNVVGNIVLKDSHEASEL